MREGVKTRHESQKFRRLVLEQFFRIDESPSAILIEPELLWSLISRDL